MIGLIIGVILGAWLLLSLEQVPLEIHRLRREAKGLTVLTIAIAVIVYWLTELGVTLLRSLAGF